MGWNKQERKTQEKEKDRKISKNISKEAKFFEKWGGINGKGRRERKRERFLERGEEDPSPLRKQNFLRNRME